MILRQGSRRLLGALRPFDEQDAAVSGLIETEFVDGLGVFEAVEVGVPQGDASAEVFVDEHECGRVDGRRGVESAPDALSDHGFAGAEVAFQQHDAAVRRFAPDHSAHLTRRFGIGAGEHQRLSHDASVSVTSYSGLMDKIHITNFLPVAESALDVIRAVDDRIEIHQVSQNLVRWMREPQHPQVDIGSAIEEGREIQERDRIWFTFFSGDLAGEATALEWIALASAGANQILDRPIREDVIITKMPGLAARVIAEWVLAFMLMDAKQMPQHVESQRRGVWTRSDPQTLEGATVGIIGYGAIGAEIARLCDAFGSRVVGIRRRASGDGAPPADAPDSVALVWPPERLHDVLAESDYVVLAVPLTEDTYQLIGAEELAAMKTGAALINIARGEVVDWDAQVAALQSGQLRASYTDVTSPEPLPEGHPLWNAPNLFITPHNSGLQPNYFGKAARRFADNLRRYLRDEPLMDVVDRHAGY